MAAFMFELGLPVFTKKVMSLIPGHRQHINKLFSEGKILSYSVSLSRDKVWCVANAEDEIDATELISTFPLFDSFTEISCSELLFHNTVPASMPGIVLN